MESSTILELIQLLEKANKSEAQIIDSLRSIIQNQVMYGGHLQDKIDYCIAITKKELKLI